MVDVLGDKVQLQKPLPLVFQPFQTVCRVDPDPGIVNSPK
jgi:hypothetical protein